MNSHQRRAFRRKHRFRYTVRFVDALGRPSFYQDLAFSDHPGRAPGLVGVEGEPSGTQAPIEPGSTSIPPRLTPPR